jgi:hypothetical protein
MSIDDLSFLKDRMKVYIDPGKTSILTMYGDTGVYSKYTKTERDKAGKKKLYNKRRLQIKNEYEVTIEGETVPKNMTKLEEEIPPYSKSCVYDQFIKYVAYKNKYFREFSACYNNEKFRKLKWYSQICKQRQEEQLVKRIKLN